MIPILFNYNATTFDTHGIGDLMETIRCESVVNAVGEYELELDYPAGGEFINQLVINNIIYAKVNDHGNYQAFRIYSIDKAINSLVTIHAQHLSYDLAGVVVKAYKTQKCSEAVSGLKTNAVANSTSNLNLFSITTNIPDTQEAQNQDREFKMEEPTTLRAALLDGDDSIKGCWGGDLVFDNYNISLLSVAGADRGVLVEYGIDLIDMNQEENISEMITGVYPYWKGREKSTSENPQQEDKIVYGDVQYAAGTFAKHRLQPLNVTEYYPNNDTAPTVAQINQTAKDWIKAGEIGQPQINLTLSYAQLGKDVRIHDAITVRFVKIGIDVKAKVVTYKYDTLRERCVEVEVGSVKPSILFSLEDASRLKRGLLPPERIRNNSIDSEKLNNGSVGGSKLASDSVSNWHLKDGSVSTTKIDDDAVTTEKVHDWAITTSKVGDVAITSAKIADAAVTNRTIGDAEISSEKIGEGQVQSINIGDSAITSVKIKDGAVIEAKVHDAAISTRTVQDLAINSAKVGNSAITSVKIVDGAVVKGKIGNYAVEYENVENAEIDQLKLNDFSITSAKLDGSSSQTRRQLPDGTWVNINPCVVTMKIGNTQVADIKLSSNAQGAISAVWEIQNLLADYAQIKRLVTDNLSAQYGVIGNISTSSLRINGHIVQTTSIEPGVPYHDVLYLGGYY